MKPAGYANAPKTRLEFARKNARLSPAKAG
jgi:hypothetical protein